MSVEQVFDDAVKHEKILRLTLKNTGQAKVAPFSTLFIDGEQIMSEGTWLKPDETDYIDFVFYADKGTHHVKITEGSYSPTTIYDDMKFYIKDSENDIDPEGDTPKLLSLACSPNEAGVTWGEGSYKKGLGVPIGAKANENYVFAHWSDGPEENPRVVALTCDTTLTACFMDYNKELQAAGWSVKVGEKTYQLSKMLVTKDDVRKNFDGTQFYRSQLLLTVKKGDVSNTYVVDKDIYTMEDMQVWSNMHFCMALDFDNNRMVVFANSKDEGDGYGMDGLVWTSSISDIKFEREYVFSSENHGWYPYFVTDNNGKLLLNYFGFDGYKSIQAYRNSDGKWVAETFDEDATPSTATIDRNTHDHILVIGTTAETQAYSVYKDGTLTFYYDEFKKSRKGTAYDLNNNENNPDWYDEHSKITNVVFDTSFSEARPTSTFAWFYNMSKLTAIEGMEYLNTSETKTLRGMFSGCSNLTSIDLSHIDASKNTSTQNMFRNCSKLKSIDLSHFNTSKVENMNYMFYNCSALTSIDLSNITLNKSTSTTSLLSGASSLKEVTIKKGMENLAKDAFSSVGTTSNPCHIIAPEDFDFGVDTYDDYFEWKSGIFYIQYETAPYTVLQDGKLTFYYNKKRRSWENKSQSSTGPFVYDLNVDVEMPAWNDKASTVTAAAFDISFADYRPTSTFAWFYNMSKLTAIEGMEYLNTSETKTLRGMFSGCSKLTSIDITHFDTSENTSTQNMFRNCSKLKSIDLSHFNTSKVVNMNYMFYNCSALTSIDLSNITLNKSTSTTSLLSGASSLKEVTITQGMENLAKDAFNSVGTVTTPCTIIAPEGFNFGVNTSGDYFLWKSGYFKLVTTDITELLDFSQLPPYSHVEIFNAAGKMMKSMSTGEYPQTLDLNGLGTGVFIVKINSVTYKIVRK